MNVIGRIGWQVGMPMASLMAAFTAVVLGLSATAFGNAGDPVSKAEAWFDSISTMKADFTQVASDGTAATGELHLRRPHRMKIIYDLDEPLILLTTPVWLHVDRPDDKRVTSYPIRETPLSLILQEQVALRSPDFETRHSVRNGITEIVLIKDTGEGAGELTLEFTNKPFELRKWTIRDAADVTTMVTLQNMKFGHKYENKFFAKSEYPEEK